MSDSAEFYKRIGRVPGDLSLAARRQDVERDKKWKLFLRAARRFRHVPFLDFALGAGSMALGNVKESSDFDVIVGCRYGRIFTARFFAIALFALTGERRKHLHFGEEHDLKETANKLCFNHFVTEKSLRLSPPHNLYWRELYKHLRPLYGSREALDAFFAANSDWMGEIAHVREDKRYLGDARSSFRRFGERFLSGRVGDTIEKILRAMQMKRIERGIRSEADGFEPRTRYNDSELEFHPDTKRISDMLIQQK